MMVMAAVEVVVKVVVEMVLEMLDVVQVVVAEGVMVVLVCC